MKICYFDRWMQWKLRCYKLLWSNKIISKCKAIFCMKKEENVQEKYLNEELQKVQNMWLGEKDWGHVLDKCTGRVEDGNKGWSVQTREILDDFEKWR